MKKIRVTKLNKKYIDREEAIKDLKMRMKALYRRAQGMGPVAAYNALDKVAELSKELKELEDEKDKSNQGE